MFVEVVCLQQTEVEMLKCHTQIWLLHWDLAFHKPILGGFTANICHEKKEIKTSINLQLRMSSLKAVLNWTALVYLQSHLAYTWLDHEVACGRFSSPSVWSGCSGPPHIKNPLNRARLRAYTVCSVADRNAGQAVVWLSGYSECCGGGWVESKHRQGLHWLWDAWLSSRRWERASACYSSLWGWVGGQSHRG